MNISIGFFAAVGSYYYLTRPKTYPSGMQQVKNTAINVSASLLEAIAYYPKESKLVLKVATNLLGGDVDRACRRVSKYVFEKLYFNLPSGIRC